MNARALLDDVRRRGLVLELVGPDIRVRTGGHSVPPDLVDTLRAHKPALVALLQVEQSLVADPAAPKFSAPTGPCNDAETLDVHVAIATGESGVPLEWAQALIPLEYEPPPTGLSAAAWRTARDALWRFAEAHRSALECYAWTPAAVFVDGWPWQSPDKGARCWIRDDAVVDTIDAAEIAFVTAQGRRWSVARR